MNEFTVNMKRTVNITFDPWLAFISTSGSGWLSPPAGASLSQQARLASSQSIKGEISASSSRKAKTSLPFPSPADSDYSMLTSAHGNKLQQQRKRQPDGRMDGQADGCCGAAETSTGFRREVQLEQAWRQLSAAHFCRPPLLPRMLCLLAAVPAGLAQPLTFDLWTGLRPAGGGAD